MLAVWLLFVASTRMSDDVPLPTQNADDIPTAKERVRRAERWPDGEQAPAAATKLPHPSQKWQCFANVSQPAGGKNAGRKSFSMGPYRGATAEEAEQRRAEGVDAWLHEPRRAARGSKQQREEASSSQEPPDAKRASRRAAPVSFAEQSTMGPRPGKAKAGSGCASPARARAQAFSPEPEHPARHVTRRTRARRGNVQQEPPPPVTTEEWLLPPEMTGGHWLQAASTKRLWQTEHHKELEQKLAEARAQAAILLGENETLRARASLPPAPHEPATVLHTTYSLVCGSAWLLVACVVFDAQLESALHILSPRAAN